jgi:hypothetical protein
MVIKSELRYKRDNIRFNYNINKMQKEEDKTPMCYEDAKVPPEIWDGKFVFKSLIGYGGQGTVCVYTEKATNIDHAVKFDAMGQNNVL